MDTREIVSQAWERAKAMPIDQRFTALDILGDAPRPYWSDIQAMLRSKTDRVEGFMQGRHVESGDPKIGRVLSFMWVGEEE